MTRDEAVKMWRVFGVNRMEADLRRMLPQHVVDDAMNYSAEDAIDGLIALGLLIVDQPSP
jgi:hypothetical protein